MQNYNIVKISEVKSNELSEFYKKVFLNRHKTLSSHWKWWYRLKYLDFEPLILLSDNKIIGQAGLIPLKLIIDNKIIPAIWFIDFVVLPEYQGKGFGQILTEEWMKICPNQITFCNEKSL